MAVALNKSGSLKAQPTARRAPPGAPNLSLRVSGSQSRPSGSTANRVARLDARFECCEDGDVGFRILAKLPATYHTLFLEALTSNVPGTSASSSLFHQVMSACPDSIVAHWHRIVAADTAVFTPDRGLLLVHHAVEPATVQKTNSPPPPPALTVTELRGDSFLVLMGHGEADDDYNVYLQPASNGQHQPLFRLWAGRPDRFQRLESGEGFRASGMLIIQCQFNGQIKIHLDKPAKQMSLSALVFAHSEAKASAGVGNAIRIEAYNQGRYLARKKACLLAARTVMENLYQVQSARTQYVTPATPVVAPVASTDDDDPPLPPVPLQLAPSPPRRSSLSATGSGPAPVAGSLANAVAANVWNTLSRPHSPFPCVWNNEVDTPDAARPLQIAFNRFATAPDAHKTGHTLAEAGVAFYCLGPKPGFEVLQFRPHQGYARTILVVDGVPMVIYRLFTSSGSGVAPKASHYSFVLEPLDISAQSTDPYYRTDAAVKHVKQLRSSYDEYMAYLSPHGPMAGRAPPTPLLMQIRSSMEALWGASITWFALEHDFLRPPAASTTNTPRLTVCPRQAALVHL